MANMIARLGVVLGLDSAEFSRGLDAAGKKLEQFSVAAEKFGKIGATALLAASVAAVKYADELADVAEANEVAIGTVLQLSNALANSGGKAENAGKMLSAFAKFIDEAAGGSEKAQKTAKSLGISLQDLGKLSQEELLNKLVANLAKVEDPITRNAKAMEIFSKAAKGVDMVGFAEKMSQVNPLIEEQEKAIKAAADTYDLLAQTSRDVMLVLATELGPILKTTIDYFKTMSDYGVSLGSIFKVVFQTVSVLGANVAFVFKGIADEIQHTYENAVTLVTKGVNAAIEANKKYDAYRASQRQNLDFFESQVMGTSYGRSGVHPDRTDNLKSKSSSGGGRLVTDAEEKERQRKAEAAAKEAQRLAEKAERERLRALEKYFNELQRLDKILLDVAGKENSAFTDSLKRIENDEQALKIKNGILVIEKTTRDMLSEDIQLTKDLYLAEQNRLQNIKEIEYNNLLSADTKKYLIAQENTLADATERYLRAQNQAVKAQREGTGEQGFLKEGAKFFRDMPTDLENGAKAFQSVMGNMESALDNFVRTGKLSFKSLARSIIQDLIAIQIKASASSIFKSLFGMYAGGGFGTGNTYGNQDLGNFLADGGSANANTPYVVGERGPELFVPRSSGTVIPNHALGGVGGTTMVTNNYINAIDTKSFEERLYGSSNAIWAANQYANKSLAVNRGRA
jgi:lambda family phage tail tape measure protein